MGVWGCDGRGMRSAGEGRLLTPRFPSLRTRWIALIEDANMTFACRTTSSGQLMGGGGCIHSTRRIACGQRCLKLKFLV